MQRKVLPREGTWANAEEITAMGRNLGECRGKYCPGKEPGGMHTALIALLCLASPLCMNLLGLLQGHYQASRIIQENIMSRYISNTCLTLKDNQSGLSNSTEILLYLLLATKQINKVS